MRPNTSQAKTSRRPEARHVASPCRFVTAVHAASEPPNSTGTPCTGHPRGVQGVSFQCPSQPESAPVILAGKRPSAVYVLLAGGTRTAVGMGNDHDNAAAASTGVRHSHVFASAAPVAIALRTVFTPPAAALCGLSTGRW